MTEEFAAFLQLRSGIVVHRSLAETLNVQGHPYELKPRTHLYCHF